MRSRKASSSTMDFCTRARDYPGNRPSGRSGSKRAKSFSGTRREFRVTNPQGIWIDFDAKRGEVVYEVKTGYEWMLNRNLGPDMQRRRAQVIDRFHEQADWQFAIATQCGYMLDWYFNTKKVAEFFDPLLEPPVKYKTFDCDKDSDHTW